MEATFTEDEVFSEKYLDFLRKIIEGYVKVNQVTIRNRAVAEERDIIFRYENSKPTKCEYIFQSSKTPVINLEEKPTRK